MVTNTAVMASPKITVALSWFAGSSAFIESGAATIASILVSARKDLPEGKTVKIAQATER